MASKSQRSARVSRSLDDAPLPQREDLVRFFQTYDSLQSEASTLSSDRQALEDARSNHRDVCAKLEQVTSSFKWNERYMLEQVNRIDLVSNHWCYGTTLLQPQLWLRGGCQGKIDRAKAKLEKAIEDHPKWEQMEADTKEREAVAREYKRRKEVAFERSRTAKEEATKMKDEVIKKNPSQELQEFRKKVSTIRSSIDVTKYEETHLAVVGSKLRRVKQCASNVEDKVKSSEKKMSEADELSREEISPPWLDAEHCRSSSSQGDENGRIEEEELSIGGWGRRYTSYKKYDANNNVVLTNHPCPSGCGYVLTWHGTHCCSACSNPNNNAKGGRGRHGPKCERVSLSSQGGAKELWNLLQGQRKEHEEKVDSMRRDAADELEGATRELQDGFELLRKILSDLLTDSGGQSSATTTTTFVLPSIVGHSFVRQSALRVQAHQLESVATEQEGVLRQKVQAVNNERRGLEIQLSEACQRVDEEREAIFARLRMSSEARKTFDQQSATAAATSGDTPGEIDIDHIPVAAATVIDESCLDDVVAASVMVQDDEDMNGLGDARIECTRHISVGFSGQP